MTRTNKAAHMQRFSARGRREDVRCACNARNQTTRKIAQPDSLCLIHSTKERLFIDRRIQGRWKHRIASHQTNSLAHRLHEKKMIVHRPTKGHSLVQETSRIPQTLTRRTSTRYTAIKKQKSTRYTFVGVGCSPVERVQHFCLFLAACLPIP